MSVWAPFLSQILARQPRLPPVKGPGVVEPERSDFEPLVLRKKAVRISENQAVNGLLRVPPFPHLQGGPRNGQRFAPAPIAGAVKPDAFHSAILHDVNCPRGRAF